MQRLAPANEITQAWMRVSRIHAEPHRINNFEQIGVEMGAALFRCQTLHFLIDKHMGFRP